MITRGGRAVLLAISAAMVFVPAVPAGVAAVQEPPGDTIRASLPTEDVQALFGERSVLVTGDAIQPTVTTPEVEEIFRSRLEIAIATGGGVLDPNGFSLVVTGLGTFPDTMIQRVSGQDTIVAFALTGPGDYAVTVDGLDAPCVVPTVPPVSLQRGMTERARVELDCLQPTSLTVVSDPATSPFGSPSIRLGGQERDIGVGAAVTFDGLEPGPNELRLSIPESLQGPSLLEVSFPPDVPEAISITIDGGRPQLVLPDQTVTVRRPGGESFDLTLHVTRPAESVPSSPDVAVEVAGRGAAALRPGMATIRIRGGARLPVHPDSVIRFGRLAQDSIRLVLELDERFPPMQDGWHLSAGLGAIAVAATDPKSFITPTVGLSLVKGPERAENLYLNAQFGYWRSGPSSADPVLPEDPRPPFQNRTIWTWALGASYFGTSWGGLGVSASWVEGRETASEEDKYINRSRGVAVGPRFRLLTDDPWPSVIFGLDAQYGEADELLLAEPDWRWSLTPVLSLSYVFR